MPKWFNVGWRMQYFLSTHKANEHRKQNLEAWDRSLWFFSAERGSLRYSTSNSPLPGGGNWNGEIRSSLGEDGPALTETKLSRWWDGEKYRLGHRTWRNFAMGQLLRHGVSFILHSNLTLVSQGLWIYVVVFSSLSITLLLTVTFVVLMRIGFVSGGL